ncbi:MAG: glycosyltransferase family 39 protein, partial [Acidobacteria bacterium]|nr:glycosyltransferase family 39 protein [Acidobacteriota bacterium]
SFGLPHVEARPDESVAIDHAIRILQGDFNPHFFHWPSLHLYVLALIYGADAFVRTLAGAGADAVSFTHYALLGRGYVALAGVLTIPVLFRMTRRVAGSSAALVAAAFLAVAPLHVRDSHFAMTDVTMTLLVTSALWLIVEAACRLESADAAVEGAGWPGLRRTMGLAGIAAGLAASTKYNAAAVIVPAALVQLCLARRAVPRWRLGVWMPGVLFAACFAAGFLVATPFAVLDADRFRTDLIFDVTHLSAGHGPALGRGWARHFWFSLPTGLGVPLFAAACAGVVVAVRRKGCAAWVILAFAAAFYGSIGSGFTVFARYVLPLVPVGCLLAALVVEALSRAAAARLRRPPARVLLVLAALVAAPSLVNSVWLDVLLSRTDTRVLAARWLTAELPPDSTVYESGREYVQVAIRSPRLHRWYYDPDTAHFVGATADMLPQWLVLHRSPLAAYTPIPASVDALARERYRLVQVFAATNDGARAADYDQQDAFFLPLRGFDRVMRPGTTISVYTRLRPIP